MHASPFHHFRLLHAGVAAWLLSLLPGLAFAQMLEERERDEPAAERPAGVPEETTPDLSDTERLIVEKTNAFRQDEQLEPVQPNPKLNETAQYFADFMARTGKYGHTADGQRPSQRASNHGYAYCIVSENIAYQFRSTGFTSDELAERFFSGWKHSPEHRENMVDPGVTEIGLAVARQEGSPTYFAVQMFGRPKSKSISFEVDNRSGTEVKYTVRREGSDRTFPLPPRLRRTHQRCRPTQLQFSQPDTTIDVQDGATYVVQQSPEGGLEVIRQ